MRDVSTPALVTAARTGGLADTVHDLADRVPALAQLARRDPADPGRWHHVSAAAFRAEVLALAKGLLADGLRPGDRVAVMSRTRYEWTLFSYAVWSIGAHLVPVYPTASTEQLRALLAATGADTIVIEHEQHAMTVAAACGADRRLRRVWQLDQDCVGLLSGLGGQLPDAEVHRLRRAVTPRDTAAVIQTSGTTGRPRGCVITHGNLAAECDTLLAGWGRLTGPPGTQPSILAFLPLAHSYGLMVQVACLRGGILLGHEPELTPQALLPALASFRPTFLFGVPYVFEKIYDSARRAAEEAGRLRMFDVATATALRYARAVERREQGHGHGPSPALRARHALYERLVYGRIRGVLGGRVRNAVSGGSPLRADLGRIFAGAGLTVYDGYGLSETSGAVTACPPGRVRFGTVGRPLPGCAVRIAQDGEVWVRGDVVFAGYVDEHGTSPHDGWFATGDLGHLDEDGYLVITGRKKDIIITSGGKSVAPLGLEERVRAHPLVSQCLVVGDNRPYVAALITLDPEALAHWRRYRGGLEDARPGDPPEEGVRAAVQRAVAVANASVSRAESIRAFRILPGEFSVADGLLTPSLKLRRAAIERAYAAEIDALYAG
ncbi:AMP-dependent synthetase/ligase [Streptomyces purpurogeneiscleroticus]|uniref:AMP-dependent synthetase/ligase n=1 Tax=Streptomyces purpurogeneiscleroticus TaxID=68259 RepID=UPI001CBA7D8C|nr:AMP-dependent synthetase/ligase [Streptomyces purpurogeneiscleroticus]MBZ4017203.1 long-chain fatty acid--CoA ligase [Streptomyces purpurogeneiscleroticus]